MGTSLIARLAEIKQQTESQTGRFQIIGALHSISVVQRSDGLQLDQTHVVDQRVHEILTYQDAFLVHLGAVLLHSREAGGTDFICQRVLIDLFQEPALKRIE
jgi:hypothetical protein